MDMTNIFWTFTKAYWDKYGQKQCERMLLEHGYEILRGPIKLSDTYIQLLNDYDLTGYYQYVLREKTNA